MGHPIVCVWSRRTGSGKGLGALEVWSRLLGMSESEFDARVDAYIAKAAPFAQPVLEHLRELGHKACPEVEETIKWSMPFFVYREQIVANMAAFKAHCSFGIWGKEIVAAMRQDGLPVKGGMGSLGKIASVKDLPRDAALLGYLRQATVLVKDGSKTFPKRAKAAKPEVEVPAELAAALKKNKTAAKVFAEFSRSCRREYVDWIADAKRAETKDKRVAQAVEWIAEGKQRNWKYQNC
jgi:uncharacterized protein YdeI (YjbR/CyaY-like superfamily)